MDFGWSEEQRDFAASLRAFARQRLRPRYAADDRAATLRPGLAAELAGMGLTGLGIPEHHGGQAADAVTTGLACEEIGREDINAAYLLLLARLVAEVLLVAGTEEQCARSLPPIAAGDVLPCLCLTEPGHGSDAANLTMRAERDGDGWRLTGEKTSISLGMHADTALVFARTGGPGARGVSAFYLELDERHLHRAPFSDLGSRAIGRAALHFDGHPAGPGTLLGAEGEGFVRCMEGFDFSRALIGLMCLGTAQQALDDAIDYARERQAFGAPIGTQQGVAFPLVEAATQLRGARWLCYEALWLKDQGRPHAMEAGMAKWWAPELAVDVTHRALLTFGHAGYSEELPAGQRLRDVIGLEIGDGTAQIAKLVAARHLLGRAYAP
jgi:cyclohexanecarboxyl-CoA dehydrogenase